MTLRDEKTIKELAVECGIGEEGIFLETEEVAAWQVDLAGERLALLTMPGDEAVAYVRGKYLPFVLRALQDAVSLENGAMTARLLADIRSRELEVLRAEGRETPRRFVATFVGSNNAEVVVAANAQIGRRTSGEGSPMPARIVAG